MTVLKKTSILNTPSDNLVLSSRANLAQNILAWIGQSFLFLVTATAAMIVLFIIFYIAKNAIPFFQIQGLTEFFTSAEWYPSGDPPAFGVLAIMLGSTLVTLGAIVVTVPLGVAAAVCLSDILPFSISQTIKPIVEILAAIPSVAYGFFALVIFAPLLQEEGGRLLMVGWYLLAVPFLFIITIVISEMLTFKITHESSRKTARTAALFVLGGSFIALLIFVGNTLGNLTITTGTNALNVSIILGIMALPTVVSVSQDALQAVGRELRDASYALGATRAETLIKVIMPAASGGIFIAVLLGIMRALGETMVVWMASGNAAQIPSPWFNYLQPVRTLTATIAGDMGEADQVTGSSRYHVLFAMGLILLMFCFLCNLVSEWIVSRQRKKLRGEN